jgi:hypothetical protein
MATGYVELKASGRRVYANLRFWCDGRTTEVYIGAASGDTREERLKRAWAIAHSNRLLDRSS